MYNRFNKHVQLVKKEIPRKKEKTRAYRGTVSHQELSAVFSLEGVSSTWLCRRVPIYQCDTMHMYIAAGKARWPNPNKITRESIGERFFLSPFLCRIFDKLHQFQIYSLFIRILILRSLLRGKTKLFELDSS